MTVGIPTLPPTPGNGPARNWRGLVAVMLIGVIAAGAGIAWWQTRTPEVSGNEGLSETKVAAPSDTAARAPRDVRIRVRVVNISGVTGLARRTTQHLRLYGFDVVDFLSSQPERNASTRIAVHTGHEEWGLRVQKALGLGTVIAAPDSSRYADLTVFVGGDWRPTAKSLRP
ncbi:LytR C-terminal domain-containing protein [Gemmatimonas phototrophica]|uniref:LytR C-terminal domain-containing protein n=1 Tax=Gemmatimonas phototrophica TaxID=1379270 RepID=UPI00047C8E31|nr:LytR C-terminal domain-containing protein [Gemmatimonas phototrophica]